MSAAIAQLTAAVSVGAALIPAGLAPLRYEVAPASGPLRQVFVSSGLRTTDSAVVLGGGAGHVVAMRQTGKTARSSLYDLTVGRRARRITTFPHGGAITPTVGTDARDRPVVVVKPCAPSGDGRIPRCDLVSVDVASGRQRTLAGTETAVVGAMDRGLLATATSDVRVTIGGPGSTPASAPMRMPIGSVVRVRTHGDIEGGLGLDTIGFAHGVVAITVIGSTEYGGESLLLVARVGMPWHVAALLSTGGAGSGSKSVVGPQVTSTGVRAYADGATDDPSYAGRWSFDGKLVRKVSARSLGSPAYVGSAGFLGDTLITAPSDECYAGCQVEAAGPAALG